MPRRKPKVSEVVRLGNHPAPVLITYRWRCPYCNTTSLVSAAPGREISLAQAAHSHLSPQCRWDEEVVTIHRIPSNVRLYRHLDVLNP